MGAKSGQSDRSGGRQRLWLALFGALLVVLFLAFAVAQGIGNPSVPSGDVALVEDVPAEVGEISEEEFERALAQQIAQQISEGALKKAPKEGSEKYEELKAAALGELLDMAWIQGESEELGISVTDKQIANQLDEIKKQSFPTPAAFKEFLESTKFTREDVERRVELQLLSEQIQQVVSTDATAPSNEEIADFYEAAKETQFTTGPTRDVRIIVNGNKGEVEKAIAELESDSSPAGWKKAAKKHSEDPSTSENGGLQEGLSEETLPEPLKADVFEAATGELIGPLSFQGSFAVIEVVELNPEKTQSLGEVRAQISQQLGQQAQQEFFSEFVADYQSKWTSRTFCAEGFVTERCSNYVGDGHPATASPACYEAEPKEGAPVECPAPVAQLAPALPGTVSVLQPQGERLPQRPLPEPSEEAAGGEGATLEQLESAAEEAAGAEAGGGEAGSGGEAGGGEAGSGGEAGAGGAEASPNGE